MLLLAKPDIANSGLSSELDKRDHRDLFPPPPPPPECFHAPEAEGGGRSGGRAWLTAGPRALPRLFLAAVWGSGALGCGVVRVWGAYFPRHPRFPLPSLGGRCGPRGNHPGWGSDAWRSVRFSRGFPVDRPDAATRANERVGAAATPGQPTRWRWKADRDCRSCVKRAFSVAHLPSPTVALHQRRFDMACCSATSSEH